MHEPNNEVHVTTANNGHIPSTDCWCEPTLIRRVTNAHNVEVLVVEHNDETLDHRQSVVHARTKWAAGPAPYSRGSEAAWITNALDKTWNRARPPEDPHERNL